MKVKPEIRWMEMSCWCLRDGWAERDDCLNDQASRRAAWSGVAVGSEEAKEAKRGGSPERKAALRQRGKGRGKGQKGRGREKKKNCEKRKCLVRA